MWRSNVRIGALGLPAAALVALCISAGASADTPPNLPLPPCTIVGGVKSGACPAESDEVSGSAAGHFGFGGNVIVTTNPTDSLCSTWDKDTDIWSPSPCFARVSTASVVGCATIDLQDGKRFRELPCAQALYRNPQGLGSLFTARRPNGSTGYDGRVACGDTPDFNTFIYGGPFTKTETIWSSRAASALPCEVSFTGPRRPDGLYGPTWVKLRVEIGVAQTGGNSSAGSSASAELYVPIDGDLRDYVDVDVTATATMQNADWDNGKLSAIYRATLSNRGGGTVDNVELAVQLPPQLRLESISDTRCIPGTTASSRGGSVQCPGLSLGSGSFSTIEFVVRVVNATDLDSLQNGQLSEQQTDLRSVQFQVRAANDIDTSNNEAIALLDLPFRSGSYAATVSAMDVLTPYFNYETDIRSGGCNQYKDDIFNRLEAIRAAHPEVFANLSYGGITSGQYSAGGLAAGHVGVVVYPKGTNYRQTGIIINGTPFPSPLNLVSMIGASDRIIPLNFATSVDGLYLRTKASDFPGAPPGRPQEEATGGADATYGFEGRYAYNSAEFGGASAAPAPAAVSCPFAPDAVMVTTESPVEVILTNSRGQRVVTGNGLIVTQELDGGINSLGFRHMDGSYGWTLGLPLDTYNVQLRGTGTGPYRLTLTTFAADGTRSDVVTSGSTTPGQIDQYTLTAPAVVTPPPPTPTTPDEPTASNGGGSFDVLSLASMLGLLALRLGRRSSRRRRFADIDERKGTGR